MANSPSRELHPRPTSPAVLVVDDEPLPRLLTGRTLEAAGFCVSYATNGTDALHMYARERPDIVLLDVVMPDLSGYDVCEQIRASPGGNDVTILMMTGLDDAASIDRAYAVNATDFAVKPVNPRLLAHRLRYLHRAMRAAVELRESERRLLVAERIAKIGHYTGALDGAGLIVSDQAAVLLGLPAGARVSLVQLLAHVPANERSQVEEAVRNAVRQQTAFAFGHQVVMGNSVTHVWQEGHVESGTDDGRVVATVRDVTEQRRQEREITRLAYFDSLTGLANRVLLRQNLERVLDLARRHRRNAAVLCLDLDLFKRVNDTLGHSAGDELLKATAKRLQAAMRASDCISRDSALLSPGSASTIGRVGGDEFTLVLSEIRRSEDAAIVAQRILDELAKPFTIQREQVFVGASIGIAVYPDDGTDVEDLTKNADAALYHAKSRGRSRFAFYTASLNEETRRRMALESGLRGALQTDGFELHYQPKVDLPTGRVVGVEALIRWNHPTDGMIPPLTFIPVAEDTGLIVQIGAWVIRTACAQLRRWDDDGLDSMTMSVNVAARQFGAAGFVDMVAKTLAATGIEAARLELEITESTLMDDADVSVAVLHALRALGVRVAIDDFGTGYSSLSYLKRFPIDVLKVDRSFVQDIPHDSDNKAIAQAIIAMGGSLHMDVVAEGVETDEQLRFLKECDCGVAQGYLFSKPLPANEMATWVRERVAAPPSAPRVAPVLVDLSALPVLDETLVAEVFAIDASLFGELIEHYERDGAAHVDAIVESFAGADIETLHFRAHAMKGASGAIGATRVERLCHVLQTCALETAGPYVDAMAIEFAAARAQAKRTVAGAA